MRGPSRAESTSEAEKAPNTQFEETPRSRAIGSARMAGRYMLDAQASVCVVPSARMIGSGRPLMACSPSFSLPELSAPGLPLPSFFQCHRIGRIRGQCNLLDCFPIYLYIWIYGIRASHPRARRSRPVHANGRLQVVGEI